jgi:hypothetical protein
MVAAAKPLSTIKILPKREHIKAKVNKYIRLEMVSRGHEILTVPPIRASADSELKNGVKKNYLLGRTHLTSKRKAKLPFQSYIS